MSLIVYVNIDRDSQVCRVVRGLCELGVVVTFLHADAEDGIVVANEVKLRLVEGCVEHHVSLGRLPSAMLAIVEFRQREAVLYH